MNMQEYKEVDWEFSDQDWVNDELQMALDALPSNKHRSTVLRLAEAQAVGRSLDATFKLPDVCAKKTWHGPYVKGVARPGWKDDPLVKRAYNLALARMSTYQEASITANIKETTRLLADAAPKAVMTLTILMDEADSDDVKRKSANDLLDRLRDLMGNKGGQFTMSETRTISFDLSSVPMDVLDKIIDHG